MNIFVQEPSAHRCIFKLFPWHHPNVANNHISPQKYDHTFQISRLLIIFYLVFFVLLFKEDVVSRGGNKAAEHNTETFRYWDQFERVNTDFIFFYKQTN